MSTAPGAWTSVYSCGSRTSNRRAPPSSALANSSTLTPSIAMRRTLPVSVASGQVGGRVDVAHRGRIDGHLDDIEGRHRPAHRPLATVERDAQMVGRRHGPHRAEGFETIAPGGGHVVHAERVDQGTDDI